MNIKEGLEFRGLLQRVAALEVLVEQQAVRLEAVSAAASAGCAACAARRRGDAARQQRRRDRHHHVMAPDTRVCEPAQERV